MAEDDDAPWYRSLLTGVGALLGVALLVGGVISLVALGAVSVSGIGEETQTVQEEPSLYIPDRSPGASAEDDDDPGLTLEDLNGGVDPTNTDEPEATKSPREDKKRKRKPPRSVISLSASPLDVAAMERIYLTGTYPGGEGASLQVQRFEGGGWTDFPTSASVSGGTFSTYVMTGQTGANKFRVVDSGRGKASNPVTVRVG
ncbi:MAG TPA: hypothetical protein VFR87_18325 [Nocardioidaceae bacterium]|nr:hypothetical protein [Nocardioidaceae bacterium]